MGKDIIEELSHADIVCGVALAHIRTPKLVMLGETGFDLVKWEVLLDVGLAATAVARVLSVTFADELFHFWDEGLGSWEREVGECDVGGGETAVEGTGVVSLGHWDLLSDDLTCPESVGFASLLFPFFG